MGKWKKKGHSFTDLNTYEEAPRGAALKKVRLSTFVSALKAELLEAASFGRPADPDIPEFVLAEARASFFYQIVDIKENSLIVSLDVQNVHGDRARRLGNLNLVFKDEDILSAGTPGNPLPNNN